MLTNSLFRLHWAALFLVNAIVQVHSSSADRVGRCPAGILDSKSCNAQADQCQSDSDCAGESLCCSTGCNKVCMLPAFTACDHSRLFYEKQARVLGSENVHVPTCTESGNFEEVQCNENTGTCWCVDGFGFEKGGTRSNSREKVNCTRSTVKCSGPQCRMLCPYGFELDSEGCEMCVCKDICDGVKCPGSLECQLQEVSCVSEPCPPVPTCKKPRTLESLCPVGVPFTIPESGNPFLCGTTPGKPTCPTGFTCSVNTGDDYGICCGSDSFYEKPGLCPVVSSAVSNCNDSFGESYCRNSCKHDLECPEMKKCCMTESRGKQCTSALNSTLCLQQKKIAEILSTKEKEGRGYIPQCDANGDFIRKQCSRNGKICWCVDDNGRNLPQSLSLAEFVNCPNASRRRDLVPSNEPACDINLCANTCEFGFKTDEVSGCGTCDCNENLCESLSCPEGSKCLFTRPKDCQDDKTGMKCQMQASCVTNVLHVNPCDSGTPLLDHSTNQLVVCSENGLTCPSSHVCVKASVNTDGLCCLNRPRLEATKAGMCPFISFSLCNNGSLELLENKQCSADNECEGDMKCCGLPCGAICADPLLDAQTESSKMPTMCQYLENVEIKQNEVLRNFKMAMDIPKCKASGEFDEVQCNEKSCYCVDEFGIEIPSTRMDKSTANLTQEYCLRKGHVTTCLDMTCRLGCDYGYQTKDNCRICECVNPCDKAQCDENYVCEMVDMDCSDGYCPAVPYCIPKIYAAISMSQQLGKELNLCPKGSPFFDSETNDTLSCRPRARMLQCPDDFFCHEVGDSHDFGYCCPILEYAEESSSIGKEKLSDFTLGTNENSLGDLRNRKTTLSDCERARDRLMNQMEGDKERLHYIPRCNPATGDWEQIQCIDEVNMCWCVNAHGATVPGSITSGKPVCNFRKSRGKFLGSAKVDHPVCPDGKSVHVCNRSLCENKICLAYPDATCGIDPCGGCYIEFYDENKNIVNCQAGLGKCQTDIQRIMNSAAWINQQNQSNIAEGEDDLPIEHIIEDVLQERVGRALPTGSFPFSSTVGDLLAEVVRHSSVEQFGAKISEIFLQHDGSSLSGIRQRQEESPRIFSHPTIVAASRAFSNAVPMMMHKGSCPPPSPNSILFRLTGTCTDLCNYDDECQQDERCCLVECGYRCQKVQVELQVELVEETKGNFERILGEDLEESNMLLIPPACKSNGDYEAQQSQGELMWCVDPAGNPEPESLTRGFVECSPEGKMITKRSIGKVCPNSDKSPMVCTDQCVNSTCATHSDAICIADPCDDCKVSFFSASGNKLECEHKCQQPVDPGLCRASFIRYFYNTTSSQCEEFSWGGCHSNDNNFETIEECRNSCGPKLDICSLPLQRDQCNETSERWYFHAETDSCEQFLGCSGSGNNFRSKETCQSRCPIRVLCPNIVEGSLSVCNREEACEKATRNCEGLKDDEYICEVEPCSCTAEVKDLSGATLQCLRHEAAAAEIVETSSEDPRARSISEESGAQLLDEGSSKLQVSVVSEGNILVTREGFTATKTRCISMRNKYFTKCDTDGNFLPTQCSMDEPICWCVDSAGNQVEGTSTFLAGSSSCPYVPVQKINVRLSFPTSSPESVAPSQLGEEVQDLLRSLKASLEEDKVSTEVSDGFLNVDFNLIGESAVRVSHVLEEGLRQSLLGISYQNHFIPVDLANSRFHYIPDVTEALVSEETTSVSGDDEPETTAADENEPELGAITGRSDDGVTAQEVNQKELNVAAIALTVVAALTAVLILIGLVLGLQNKKVGRGNYQKNKFEPLPFSSPFEFDKKGSEEKQSKS